MPHVTGGPAGGLLTAALLVLAAACGPDRPTGPDRNAALQPAAGGPAALGGCSGGQKPGGSAEGEVFGNFYENGQRSCGNHSVELHPNADAQTRLHMPSYRPALTAQPIYVQMFEFWDPLAGGPCTATTLAGYVLNGSPTSERVHDTPGPQEGHCVRPGRYAFSGDSRSFDVDYIQPSGQHASNALTGVAEAIEVTAYDPNLLTWQDLVINTDVTSTHPGDAPVLDIQNAGASPYAGSFSNDASPSGTKDDWFRFSVARSTSGWTVNPHGSALARLYFDGTDLSQATGYYDYKPEGVPVLRLHRFPNPVTAWRVYSVGLELLRPDENPADLPSVSRNLTIYRVNPDLAPGSITMPASVTAGNSFTATVQERNLLGTADVEGGWTGALYLSTDQTLNPGSDVVGGAFAEPVAIGPSSTRTVGRTVSVPGNLAPGYYYVLARLDTANVVLEANESNNTGASAGRIQVLGPPPLSVIINYGPGSVRPNVNCEWMAQASGGVQPYSWVWRVNNKVVPSADNDIYYVNQGSSFTLSVTVTDALGSNAQNSKPITVTGSAPYCPL